MKEAFALLSPGTLCGTCPFSYFDALLLSTSVPCFKACFRAFVLSCFRAFVLSCFRAFVLSCFRAFVLSCFRAFVLSCFRAFVLSCFRAFVLSCFRAFVLSCFRAFVLSCFRAFVLSLSRAGGHVDLFAICFSAVRKFRNGREFFRCISATFKITADQAPIHRRRPSQRLLIPAKIGPLHGLDA